MGALVNVLGGEVLTLHCHENGDCQEPDDCHSERSRVSSELRCCQEEDAQIIGWCHDQDDVCPSSFFLHFLVLELFGLVLLGLNFFGCSRTIVLERFLTNGHEDGKS